MSQKDQKHCKILNEILDQPKWSYVDGIWRNELEMGSLKFRWDVVT